jgi:hypothetical protein
VVLVHSWLGQEFGELNDQMLFFEILRHLKCSVLTLPERNKTFRESTSEHDNNLISH